jgi:protein-S-isoprenylcysteine O-methyltransferase Ste14
MKLTGATHSNKMTRWEGGPIFAGLSVFYAFIALLVQFTLLSGMRFVLGSIYTNVVLGSVLILCGVPIFLYPARYIDNYFKNAQLCTQGIYAYMRHPIYTAWIVCIVPGMSILLGSPILLITPLAMYAKFKILILKEDEYLESKFGDEYRLYRSEANAVLPKLKRRTCRK